MIQLHFSKRQVSHLMRWPLKTEEVWTQDQQKAGDVAMISLCTFLFGDCIYSLQWTHFHGTLLFRAAISEYFLH